ncbi:MAG: precorrin-6A reductase [Faecousia sp.]
MSEICIFAGTSEGRELTELLTGRGIRVHACVATEYGETVLEQRENLTVSAGRLTEQDMERLFSQRHFDCVVDATHPYAPLVTENLRSACAAAGTEYLRLLRDGSRLPGHCVYAENTAQAAEKLQSIPGNILLTTGSKELGVFARLPDFAQRVYARVLPVEASILACREAGLPASHIFAMQGPFSLEMNLTMLQAANASVLVTKEAGSKGGFPEKAQAAAQAGATLLVIGRPPQVEGLNFAQIAALFAKRYGFALIPEVKIIGIGPGDRDSRTVAADRAIREADCLIGAKRMLEAAALPGQLCCEAITPEKIQEAIFAHPECRRFGVVLSGDVGFYSGAKKLLPLLGGCKTELLPGLSSLSVLCSRLGVSYEDAVCVSLHGREAGIAAIVAREPKVFVLVGGEDGMAALCRHLVQFGLGEVTVSVGEQLGYPEETITRGTAAQLAGKAFHSLSAALITHEASAPVTHGMKDEVFQRGGRADGSPVPMTKRDIRSAALSRLELRRDSVCWDIGAGTGSVAMEMAKKCHLGKVYAVEKKEEALALLEENRLRCHADNVTLVPGSAPAACADLPAPTHVFIGGSGGNIREILELAREKNPKVRIVATAIALETVAELNRCRADFSHSEVTCLTAAQAQKAGAYTLMQGQNPVYLFTFQGD